MNQLFIHIYQYFQQRKKLLWLGLAAFLLLCLGLASQLKLEEDISNIIPADPKVAKLSEVFQNSKFAEKIIINISLRDTTTEVNPELLSEFGDSLFEQVETKLFPDYTNEITYHFDDSKMMEMYDVFYENIPLFLDKEDYTKIAEKLDKEGINQTLEGNFKTLISPAGMMFKKYILKDPLGITPMGLKKLESMKMDDNFELQDGYLFSKDQRNLLMILNATHPPNETNHNTIFVDKLNDILKGQLKKHEAVHAEYFGSVPVAVGNANRIKSDIHLTVSIALVCLLLLIGFFFRRPSVFVLIILPIVFGGATSLAIMFLVKAKVSAIALGIGSVLLGIALDFSFHLFTHYRNKPDAIEVLEDVSMPLIMSCLTTASAFLCLLFVHSDALFDLGLFAAMSIVGAAVFALLILPHFFNKKLEIKSNNILDKIADYDFHKNKYLKIFIAIVSIICLFTFSKTGFDSDLNKMNYVSDELQQAEDNLDRLNDYKLKSVFLIASGKNMDEAIEHMESSYPKVKELRENGIVKKYAGLDNVLLSKKRQLEKINQWNEFWKTKKDSLAIRLKTQGKNFKFKEETFNEFYSLLNRKFTTMDTSSTNKIINLFAKDFVSQKNDVTTITTTLKVEEADKPKIYSAIEDTEHFLVFDRSYLSTKFLDILQSDFNTLVWISLIVVFIILLLAFGRLELGIIAFLPMLIGWLWTLGLMGILGIDFNIFNIIISTFIFGLGIDYSIFIMNGLIQDYHSGKKSLKSYKTSILLSGLTTIIGMGVLILAQHPALKSIASLSIIGIISVILVSFTLEPVLFNILVKKKGKHRVSPVVFSDIVVSVLTFILFLVGCIIMSILVLILKILPFPSQKKKKAFMGYCLMYFSRLINYAVFNIKKEVINPYGETFDKPAVIVCNHQSHIDLTLLLMLHPKIIILTNDWVWSNPFYGFIVRYADFYPVSKGHEESIPFLKAKMDDGYSILIFPEGTRSPDCKIKRFKKGAFYLAKELNADIVPVLLHGAGHCVTKGENYFKSGSVTVKILQRISQDNADFGTTYQVQTKRITKYMRDEFEALRSKKETPEYFKQKLKKGYLYKGKAVEKAVEKALQRENNFSIWNNLVPKKGKVIELDCGMGMRSYMLHYCSEDREIIAWDANEDNIALANNHGSKSKQVSFYSGDVKEVLNENFDTLILNIRTGIIKEKGWNEDIEWEDIWSFATKKMNPGGSILVYKSLMQLHVPLAPEGYTRKDHDIDIIEFKATN